jgi:ABC-2 type transport system ATP-binding protein
MIGLSNVSKQLGNFFIKSLSLVIPDGYICGLVGRNGSGKTSLLHLLLGLYPPDEGEVRMDELTYPADEKVIHDRIGTVLVEELFDGALSALQNAAEYGPFFSNYDAVRYGNLLREFHVEERRRFSKLSKGEKLKCQFAFALACNPNYLILDEPVANFDPEFRTQFWSVLRAFVADGDRSVILASHLTEDLDREADYLIYLDGGKAVYSGDIESFRDSYRMLSGEAWRLKGIGKEKILYLEEREFGAAKALVRHTASEQYEEAITATHPSIEEFMYFYSKYAEERKRKEERIHVKAAYQRL